MAAIDSAYYLAQSYLSKKRMEGYQNSQKCTICGNWLWAGEDIIYDPRPSKKRYMHIVHRQCYDDIKPKKVNLTPKKRTYCEMIKTSWF